ncbi:MAG: flagellar biosynthesis protein FlhB [Phycisphaerales bacterium]|nr:flagellar biosynthesis protein FlhB [Phycisphaerales bacterium]
MAEDLGERTEEATPRKRQKAREEGNVAKSVDLAGALLLLFSTLLLMMAAGPSLDRLQALVDSVLGNAGDPTYQGTAPAIISAVRIGLLVLVPLVVAGWLAAYVSHFWQVGWLITTKPLEPSLGKLNPISGIKRILGVRGLVKGGLDLGKTAIAFGVAALLATRMHDTLLILPGLPLQTGFVVIGRLMAELALMIVAALLVLAILDFIFQRWKHGKDIRMSKQEVKDELKQTEGDPLVKRRRQQFARQIAMQRINAAVPSADVVVTNPEHISVAIRYDAETMEAPVVVAIGADHLAMRIRMLAAQHKIPIVERKPLARLLYATTRVGQSVPPDAYAAVAEVLAYVYRLEGRAA